MRRGGTVIAFAALAVGGLAAGILVSTREPSASLVRSASLSKVTRVTVTATDSKFRLSRRRAPTGTVIFTVVNRGKVRHDFKIAGKKTRRLSPRHSATLRVTFSKTGRYPYRSTVRGQAAAGMKGVFVVVAAPTTTTTTTTTTGTVGSAKTTVDVGMYEHPAPSFGLSQYTMPSGMVTFVITSECDNGCSFDLEGIKAGAVLYTSDKSETWTVALPPGTYHYHCDVMPSLMKGTLTVTS